MNRGINVYVVDHTTTAIENVEVGQKSLVELISLLQCEIESNHGPNCFVWASIRLALSILVGRSVHCESIYCDVVRGEKQCQRDALWHHSECLAKIDNWKPHEVCCDRNNGVW